MEWLATLLAVSVVVLVVGAAFAYSGYRGPWTGIGWFFAILFLATLAFGVWAEPIGPRAWGVPWVGFLVAAVFVALLIAASTPDYRHGRRHAKELPLEADNAYEPDQQRPPLNPEQARRQDERTTAAVTIFFWVFAIMALGIVVIRAVAVRW